MAVRKLRRMEKAEVLTCIFCHEMVYVYDSGELVASPKLGYSKFFAFGEDASRACKYWCPCCKNEGRIATREMANVSREL